ncbi:MAG: DNA replication and repair protein RecF [Candidatus Gottesmanbacteria bacterium]|nr:DNA replication and repair protein RecF [Candidatus Gottesmanbacteria bacterium]
MILTDLTLANFRSYTKRTFAFDKATTLIVGPNTAGKTNILEAIMLSATGKSFRADVDAEMVRWGAEVGRAKATTGETKLEVVVTTGSVAGRKTQSKKFFVNGVARRQVDFIGNLRAVLFWPEHLELITDSPSLRRKYLDGVLVQVDREYRRTLLSYERGLRQRNRLLDLINEGKAHHHQLQFWDQLLIKAGGYLTDKRAAFIDFINTYHMPGVTYRVEYDKSVISESRLKQYVDEEVAAKSTLVGPHRDDFLVTKKDLDVSKYGSRGEQRLAILWLKLAELAFIERETRERPLLILDDIFSELDIEHRTLVLDLLGKQQTIVSSAEEEVVELLATHKISAKIIRLSV